MDNYTFARFKRCMDWYGVDPAFRALMKKDPARTIEKLGFTGVLEPFAVREALFYLIFGKDTTGKAEENPYVAESRARLFPIREDLQGVYRRVSGTHPKLYAYLDEQRNRCRRESELIRRHDMIYYFPFALELSSGCSVGCPFCGFQAAPFQGVFRYTEENRELFRAVLGTLKKHVGELGGLCPLYFATEPLDNPDYELFLSDAKEIFGRMPQTTTAVAQRCPTRIKKMLRAIPEKELAEQALWRFSVISAGQFREICANYSPDDLLYVELLANNPESVNALSDSGRTRRIRAREDAAEGYAKALFRNAEKRAAYSIDCVAGLKIDMVNGTIAFIEPRIPDEKYPLGYCVLAQDSFCSAEDFAQKADAFIGRFAKGN